MNRSGGLVLVSLLEKKKKQKEKKKRTWVGAEQIQNTKSNTNPRFSRAELVS